MANFLTKAFKKAGTWIDEKVGKPITEGVKTVKRTAGLEQTPLPESATPDLDPSKVAALSQYGGMVRQNANNARQPGEFSYQQYTPQQTQARTAPQTRIKEQNVQYQRNPNSYVPQERTVASPTTTRQTAAREGAMAQPALAMQGSQQQPNLQRVATSLSLQRTGNQPGAQYVREGGMSAPTMATEGSQRSTTPNQESGNRLIMEREGGNVLKLGRQGGEVSLGREGSVGLNSQPYTSAVQQALQEQMGPLNLQEGYDPAMREKAVSLATSGIDKQKERALAQMKEQQMASGNFGSSVGQREMAELAMQYDQQRQNAENQIDVQSMEAARQDRYSNQSAQQARLGQLAQIAGQGQNLELTGAQFGRQGIGADNAATMTEHEFSRRGTAADNASIAQEAQFGREGRATDRASSAAEAQFGREGRTIDEATRQREQAFGREGRQIDNSTALTMAQYGQQARGVDYARDMEQTALARQGTAADNAATTQEAQFAQGATGINNQVEQLRAEFARQGVQLDNATLMQLAQYGQQARGVDYERGTAEDQRQFQNNMQQEQFAREGRQTDFANEQTMGNQDWQRTMEANQFNQQNQGQMSDEEWRQYQEQQRLIENQDAATNEASRYNLENRAKSNEVNYGRYRDTLSDLAGYTQGNLYTPESQREAEIYNTQEANRQARLGAVINTGAAIYGASQGRIPAGSAAQSTVPQTAQDQYQLQLKGTTPTYRGSRALASYRRAA